MEWLINIFITSVCLFTLGLYFSYREKMIQSISEKKLKEVKEKYLAQIAERKADEKKEIEKLKGIVAELEKKHKEVLAAKKEQESQVNKEDLEEKLAIIKNSEEKAKAIEAEAREKAKEFYEDQKKDVQVKMVDLVMGVAKKVIPSVLSYEDHKKLIVQALKEMEGETVTHERR